MGNRLGAARLLAKIAVALPGLDFSS